MVYDSENIQFLVDTLPEKETRVLSRDDEYALASEIKEAQDGVISSLLGFGFTAERCLGYMKTYLEGHRKMVSFYDKNDFGEDELKTRERRMVRVRNSVNREFSDSDGKLIRAIRRRKNGTKLKGETDYFWEVGRSLDRISWKNVSVVDFYGRLSNDVGAVPFIETAYKEIEYVNNKLGTNGSEAFEFEVLREPRESFVAKLEDLRDLKLKSDNLVDRLFKHNLRWAVKVAKKFHEKRNSFDFIPLGDVISWSVEGMRIALPPKYDPDFGKGYRFTTFATSWSKQRMKKNFWDHINLVKLPYYIKTKINRYINNPEKIPEDERDEIENLLERQVASLDFEINDGGKSRVFGDKIEDRKTPDVLETVEMNLLREKLAWALDQLKNPRDKFVIKQMYGLDSSEGPMTLKQVGEKLDLTRERIRQIKNGALPKLKKILQSSL